MSLWSNITGLNSWANQCRLILVDLEDDLDMRSNSDYNLTANGGIGWVTWANRAVLADLVEAMQYFVYGQTSSFSYVKWLDVHQGLYEQESDLNMSGILNAMLTADPDEVTYYMGLSDAFKQSVWNRPYNKDFYAALARGFEQWD